MGRNSLVQQTPSTQSAPQPYIVEVPHTGAPRTEGELRALEFKRSQLSEQIQSATLRRRSLAEQLKSSDAAARPGIEARMKVLDARIVRLEEDLDRTGDQLANIPGELLGSTTISPEQIAERIAEKIVPLAGIFSLFVLAPLAFAIARMIWRRTTNATPRVAATDPASHQRLEQLQQSMDTIAIEIERISENQRFLSKLMNDRQLGAGVGVAEPVRVGQKVSVSGERE